MIFEKLVIRLWSYTKEKLKFRLHSVDEIARKLHAFSGSRGFLPVTEYPQLVNSRQRQPSVDEIFYSFTRF